jgi:uncharacterized protein YbcC (UPF0753/DUF2309 family)
LPHARLQHAIDHAAHLLPAQGPITVFIHHNTLHAFEDLPFTEGVARGARLFGCQPYLSEERYRDELATGRIRLADLEAVLRDDLGGRGGDVVPPHGTRFDLRRAMLQHPTRTGTTNELLWFVAEAEALRQVRPEVSAGDRDRLVSETRRWALRDLRGGHGPAGLSDLLARFGTRDAEAWDPEAWEAFTLQALWRLCRAGAETVEPATQQAVMPVRHRDLLVEVTGSDPDLLVHDLLIKFCAAFLDQGLAHWALPGRGSGFFRSFRDLFALPSGAPERWRRGLAAELARQRDAHADPVDSAAESLRLLGVPDAEWDEYIAATLLALRGWAGILRFLEERGDRAVLPAPPGSLVEYLAVRLILDRLAAAHVAREAIGFRGPVGDLRAELRARCVPPAPPSAEQRAFPVFRLAEVMAWKPEDLAGLGPADWARLIGEVEAFTGLERRRLFHLAYERRFYLRTLDALALHARQAAESPARPEPGRPRYQAVFCIDEREESYRRHLEEVAPDVETLGTAGFFSVPMYYRGAADAHYTPLCPAVMVPNHWVTEEVVRDEAEDHRWRARVRRAVGAAAYRVHVGSRTFLAGAVLAAAGVVAGVPLVTRTLFPRLTARVRRRAGSFVRPVATRLRLEREAADPGPAGPAVGFSLAEMTSIGEKVLRDLGLADGFARLVFVLGHGSSSLNNPHESAYDCGACGGSRGGPNGRAAAQVLNDPRVRAGLADRGIRVPAETVFVGGMHNTSTDELTLFDLEGVPEAHAAELDRARRDLEAAAERNAHERCRRFVSAPLSLAPAAARRHVEGRAEDLSQARPEAGHATNAICVVGRRSRTRGLFLDRRAFLNSYDPTQDDADGTVLARTLQAVFPVCGGINLEYYFSYVDNAGYGCGTKLPHNVTSLLGVMDGAGSDLRTGLPWQMVEIHEPVRLLVVLETWPRVIEAILARRPPLAKFVRNEWVRLALLDPDSPAVRVYQNGRFELYEPEAVRLPRAPSSADWYRGWRDHLEFAEVGKEPHAG